MPELLKGHIEPIAIRAKNTASDLMDRYAENAALVKEKERREHIETECRKWWPIVLRIAVAIGVIALLAAAWCLV